MKDSPHNEFVSRHSRSGMTLVELLAVIGIILLLAVFALPSLTGRKSAADLKRTADDIAGFLERARAYAMANDTYTWVGFYEEDGQTTSPTVSNPPYPGKGKVVMATVASKDGTRIFSESATAAALPSDRISQVGGILKLEGVHMADLGAPTGAETGTLDGRPSAYSAEPLIPNGRISSETSEKTNFPFSAGGYTFQKTLRFSPRGEADLYGTGVLRPVTEIGIWPSHGKVVDTNNPNLLAVQVSGVTGNVRVYRR